MGGKYLTEADHKRAFDIYLQTRSYNEVAQMLSIAFASAQRLGAEDYVCKYNCQWHSWRKLCEHHDKIMSKRLQLIETGVTDPAEQQREIDKALLTVRPAATRLAVHEFVTKDEERIAQWEHLRNRLFYQMTGVSLLEFKAKLTAQAGGTSIADAQEKAAYEGGLPITKVEEGMRLMLLIEDHIDKLLGRVTAKQEPREAEVVSDTKKPSIQELLDLKKQLENGSRPDQGAAG